MKGLAQNPPGNRSFTNGGGYSYCYCCCCHYRECHGPSTWVCPSPPPLHPPGPGFRIVWRGRQRVGAWTQEVISPPGLREACPAGQGAHSRPSSASQVSPLGSGQNPARLRQGEPIPRAVGEGEELEAPWASAAAPKWPGDVGLPCVRWLMTVSCLVSFHACSLNCILAQRRLKNSSNQNAL